MSYYVIPKSAEAIEDMPFDEYKSLPHKNQSYFKALLQGSPKHAQYQLENPSASTTAMEFGTHLHAAIFGEIDPYEDIKFCSERRNTNAWKAEERVLRPNQVLLKPAERESIIKAYEAFPSGLLNELKESRKELTVLFECHLVDSDIVIQCKARIDILGESVIRDFKTTSKGIHERQFQRMIGEYFYDMQAAFYQKACLALTGLELPFQWIVQESSAPYDVAGYSASEENLANGRSWLNEAIRIYSECLESGVYPGVWNGVFEEIDSPDWHLFEPKLDASGVREVTTL